MRSFSPSASIAMRTLRPKGEVGVERSTKFSAAVMRKLPGYLSFSVCTPASTITFAHFFVSLSI